MSKKVRSINSGMIVDPSTLDNLKYNNPAGSQKVSEVGKHLLPLKYISGGAVAYTTDASTARVLDRAGACLAIYNNSGTVQSLTLNEASTIASLAPGVTDSAGHVGIPCMPNSWTYVACGYSNWVITSSANLLVFLINDETYITVEQTY
jgi:hypothetical protein